MTILAIYIIFFKFLPKFAHKKYCIFECLNLPLNIKKCCVLYFKLANYDVCMPFNYIKTIKTYASIHIGFSSRQYKIAIDTKLRL